MVSKNYLDYFEFPRLSIKSDDETVPDSRKEILNLDSYMLQTKIKHIVEISGGELSGKTVLLKYLYSQYKNTHTPLMINEEDAATQIDRTIKNAYERQYTKDPMSYQAFQQMKKSEKIIFIDNIDVFAEKCKKPILMYLIERFSNVVYSTNLSHELNAIKILEDIIDNEELKIIKLKIEPYYIDKRTSLIRKVCKCVRDYDSEQQLEDAVEEVNKFIKNQLKVFSLNPEFIIMFTKSYILKMVESSNANAFNVVFSNNISVAIEKHRIKTNNKDNLIILQELAYYIHFNKKYPLNFACFQSIVEDYNQLHRTKNSAITILEELSNAKILKRNGDEVSFYNKTYLAYFVAKWINRKIHNGEGHNELNFVIKNICYNINSNILLFLTYLVENVGALMDILKEECEFTNGMCEFSLDKNIFTLLTQGVEELYDIAVPKNADRDMQKEKEIKIERQLIESEEIEIVNIYDENLDDFIAQQMKLFKFQEILCKILPGFYHLLTSQQQDQFVREIYKLPNKVLYCLFKPLEDNKKELLEELEGFLDSTNNTKYNNKESVKKLLSNIMSAMLLSLYDMTAVLASDEATIDALDAFNYKSDSSYFVQNIMMHENLKKFRDYIARSDELFDNTKSIYTKNLLRWIFKIHYLKNNISYKKEGQKYIDKYLGSQNIIGLKLGYTKKD